MIDRLCGQAEVVFGEDLVSVVEHGQEDQSQIARLAHIQRLNSFWAEDAENHEGSDADFSQLFVGRGFDYSLEEFHEVVQCVPIDRW